MSEWISFNTRKPAIEQKILLYVYRPFSESVMVVTYYHGEHPQYKTFWMPVPPDPIVE